MDSTISGTKVQYETWIANRAKLNDDLKINNSAANA